MKFQPRRRLGILLMVVSVVFLIAAAYASLFFVRANPQAMAMREAHIWPYKWLSPYLAIVGISLFLTGLLVGYHDDISEIF